MKNLQTIEMKEKYLIPLTSPIWRAVTLALVEARSRAELTGIAAVRVASTSTGLAITVLLDDVEC